MNPSSFFQSARIMQLFILAGAQSEAAAGHAHGGPGGVVACDALDAAAIRFLKAIRYPGVRVC